MSILEYDPCIPGRSQAYISLNCVTSTVTKIALSVLKLLFVRVCSAFVQVSSDFKVIVVSSIATVGEDHPLKIENQAFSSIDLMNVFTLTFQYV